MNLLQKQGRGRAGNALIYVLLSLALLAALTAIMMRQGDQDSAQDMSEEQAEIYASKVMAFATNAKTVTDQMRDMGTDAASLDFVLPSAAAFATAPHKNKIYHPDGGGLIYQLPEPAIFPASTSGIVPGWYWGRFNNTDWTPTSANDVLLTAYRIDKNVCGAINKRITGTSVIPAVSSSMASYFLGTSNGSGSNNPFTTSVCPTCEGYPALCASNTGATDFAFYTIISGQ